MSRKKINVEQFIVGPLQTNCYLLHDSSSLEGILIDPGAYDKSIDDSVKRDRIDLKFIVNTHGHADHIMGDGRFDAPVLIHELDEPCLRDPARSLASFIDTKLPNVKVARLLSDGDIIRIGDAEIKVLHTPGHTPGGISLLYDDLLFSGDTLFFEGVGRTDLPGGDTGALMKSINEKLLVLSDDVKVFPGHGPATTIGHERTHNPFLV